MTQEYPPVPTSPRRRGGPPRPQQGTADVVKDQAAELSQSGVQAGQHAAEVARQQAAGVVAEAGQQGRNLLGQAQDQLGEQAARGQQRLADELLSLGDQLSSMAEGSDQGGLAADLARQAAGRAREAGQWLGDRRPEQVVDELQSFARRRPAVFIALAAGVGLVAGRLTRGIKAAASDDSAQDAPVSAGAGPEAAYLPAETAYPAAETAYPAAEAAYPAGEAAYPAAEAGYPAAEAAHPAGSATGIPGVSVPSGGQPGAGDVPAADSGAAYEDGAVLGDDQADPRDLP